MSAADMKRHLRGAGLTNNKNDSEDANHDEIVMEIKKLKLSQDEERQMYNDVIEELQKE
jgi:hypothetical protein